MPGDQLWGWGLARESELAMRLCPRIRTDYGIGLGGSEGLGLGFIGF